MSVELRPLRELAHFVRGITFKPEDVTPFGSPKTIACLRTRNVQKELDTSDVWAVPARLARPDQCVQPGDILISTANSWNLVGKGCIVPALPWPATFGGFVSVLRSDPGRIDARYLYRWYSTDRVQTEVRACGRQTTNISNLDCARVLEMRIPLPPVTDQRRIAAILDQADALRVNRLQTIDKLDLLRQNIFKALFRENVRNNWRRGTLSDFADLEFGFPFKSQHYTDSEESIRLCRGANILPGRIDWSNMARWPLDRLDNVNGYGLQADDIVVAMDRPWISEGFKVAQISTIDLPALLVQRVARIRAKKGISSSYLYELVRSGDFETITETV